MYSKRSTILHNFNMSLLSPARYTVCKKADGKSVKCHVIGRYREAEIQWTLDGRRLTNSSTTNITNCPCTLNATGLYHFHSTLSTTLNTTSELKCDVKAKGLATNISLYCEPVNGKRLFLFILERMGRRYSPLLYIKIK